MGTKYLYVLSVLIHEVDVLSVLVHEVNVFSVLIHEVETWELVALVKRSVHVWRKHGCS